MNTPLICARGEDCKCKTPSIRCGNSRYEGASIDIVGDSVFAKKRGPDGAPMKWASTAEIASRLRDEGMAEMAARAASGDPNAAFIVQMQAGMAATEQSQRASKAIQEKLAIVKFTPGDSGGGGDGGGLRYNEGKARYDLIPPELMDALAAHYGAGANKYADRNWERGMSWCKCFASMMRHAWQWMRGEDFDQETGSHHMIAVVWNAAAIFTYSTRKIGSDDRPIKPTEQT